jgi:hypothetical protein
MMAVVCEIINRDPKGFSSTFLIYIISVRIYRRALQSETVWESCLNKIKQYKVIVNIYEGFPSTRKLINLRHSRAGP